MHLNEFNSCWLLTLLGARPILTHNDWFNLFNSDGQMLNTDHFYSFLLDCKWQLNTVSVDWIVKIVSMKFANIIFKNILETWFNQISQYVPWTIRQTIGQMNCYKMAGSFYSVTTKFIQTMKRGFCLKRRNIKSSKSWILDGLVYWYVKNHFRGHSIWLNYFLLIVPLNMRSNCAFFCNSCLFVTCSFFSRMTKKKRKNTRIRRIKPELRNWFILLIKMFQEQIEIIHSLREY